MDTADGTAFTDTAAHDEPAAHSGPHTGLLAPDDDLIQRARSARAEAGRLEQTAALHSARANELEAEAWRLDPADMPTDDEQAFHEWARLRFRYGPKRKRCEFTPEQIADLVRNVPRLVVEITTPFGTVAGSNRVSQSAESEAVLAAYRMNLEREFGPAVDATGGA